MTPDEAQQMRDEADDGIKEVLHELGRDAPKDYGPKAIDAMLAHFLGVFGHFIVEKRRNAAERRRNAKLAAALSSAIGKLYAIQERLMANAEYFRKELAEIKALIDEIENRRP